MLVAGGSDAVGKALRAAEVFHPTSHGFSLASATLLSASQNHAAALLEDGGVLIADLRLSALLESLPLGP